MREIKFRVWYYDTKEMEYPPTKDFLDPVVIGLDGALYQAEGEDLKEDTAKTLRRFPGKDSPLLRKHKGKWSSEIAEGYELMQYTGLKDKNGKEIYEGDIVTFIGWKNRVVTWQPTESHFAGWFAVKDGERELPLYSGEEPNTVEVIGNIHENPNLLKGETK